MKKKVSTMLALYGGLGASSIFSPLHLDYRGIVHAEIEHSLGKENNASYPQEDNSFASFFNALRLDYDVTDKIFFTLSGKANVVLGEDTYDTPIYLRAKQTSAQLNTAIVSEASATYDDEVVALSAGRIDIDFDWLLGSMDGVLLTLGQDETLSMRLFWFKNFTQLQYNYAFDVRDMNEGKGMYGAIVKATRGGFDTTVYDYYMEGLRNIAGAHVGYATAHWGVYVAYTHAAALSEALYDYDESFAEVSFEWLAGRHLFEVGGSLTGENGLLAMVQLGSFMFGQFYLSNQVDRENAQNVYGRYVYGRRQWNVELLAGATRYDNRFERIENALHSTEIDSYFGYAMNRTWTVQAGAMWMDVDERDPIGIDQTLLTVNVVYHYAYD